MLPASTLNSTRSIRSSVLPRAHARTAEESDADSAVNGYRRSSRAQRPIAAARAAAPNVMDHDGAWRGSGATGGGGAARRRGRRTPFLWATLVVVGHGRRHRGRRHRGMSWVRLRRSKGAVNDDSEG